MRFLELLANVFINTFGITQPSDRTRRRATWFILSLLLLAVAVAAAAGFIAFKVARR